MLLLSFNIHLGCISTVFLLLAWDCGVNSSSLDNSIELPESFSASVSGGFSAASACHPEGSGWLSSDESAAPSASLFFLVSNLLERHVAVQLRQHLDNNDLLYIFQSAYRQHHSAETALVRIQNDRLNSVDRKKDVLTVLLDTSAAFDTVDHSMLIVSSYSRKR